MLALHALLTTKRGGGGGGGWIVITSLYIYWQINIQNSLQFSVVFIMMVHYTTEDLITLLQWLQVGFLPTRALETPFLPNGDFQ